MGWFPPKKNKKATLAWLWPKRYQEGRSRRVASVPKSQQRKRIATRQRNATESAANGRSSLKPPPALTMTCAKSGRRGHLRPPVGNKRGRLHAIARDGLFGNNFAATGTSHARDMRSATRGTCCMSGMRFGQWFCSNSNYHMLVWLWATRGRVDVPTDRDHLPIRSWQSIWAKWATYNLLANNWQGPQVTCPGNLHCPHASGSCQPACMAPGAEGLRTKCRILYSHLFFASAPFLLPSSKVQFVNDGSGKPGTWGHNPFDQNSKSLVCLKWGFTNWLTHWKSFNILLSQNRLTSGYIATYF